MENVAGDVAVRQGVTKALSGLDKVRTGSKRTQDGDHRFLLEFCMRLNR